MKVAGYMTPDAENTQVGEIRDMESNVKEMGKYAGLPTPIYWLGTKAKMRKHILPVIDSVPRKIYVEPFGGAGGLLFGKPAEREVYNDKNKLLVNLFRELRDPATCREIERLCRLTPQARATYGELTQLVRAYLKGDEIEPLKKECKLESLSNSTAVAFALFYTLNTCIKTSTEGGVGWYGGGEKGTSWRPDDYARAVDLLPRYCARLRQTQIENLDYLDCIKRYDCATTLFYIDPPYECETSVDYKQTFDAKELVDALFQIKGIWVLSCYDTPEYQRLLKIARRQQFKATCTLSPNTHRENIARTETLYTNIKQRSLF